MSNLKLTKEEQVKDEAIRAAQKLFQQFGLAKTTMEDIAKAMGRGKSTLYYYYKSKDEIFDAVIGSEIEEVFQKIQSGVAKAGTAEEKLQRYITISFKAMKSKVNLYNTVREELHNDFSEVHRLIRKFNTSEVNAVKEILLFGVKNGEFGSSIEDEIDLVSYLIVNAFRSLTVDLVIESKFPNSDQKLTALVNMLIKALKK
jgi:AcrR family transcriptional regulator